MEKIQKKPSEHSGSAHAPLILIAWQGKSSTFVKEACVKLR